MVWGSELASQSSPDIITTQLTAGTEYSVEVSKNFTDPLEGCLPNIEVYDPSGNLVSTTLTLYPDEHPSELVHTFTPAATGQYRIQVCNAAPNTESETDFVVFVYKEMHNSLGENGYPSRFVIANSKGKVIAEADMRDILQLRKNYLKENPYFLSEVYGEANNGSDNRNRNRTQSISGTEDYNTWMDILNASVGNVEAVDPDEAELDSDVESSFIIIDDEEDESKNVTTIPATILGVPFEPEYTLGKGYLAITNFEAASETALETFYLDVPTEKTGASRFSYSFMDSREDYEQKMCQNFSLSVSKAAVGVSSSVQSSSNMRFGLTSTTLVIHYEELEPFYRELNLDKYKVKQAAVDYLNSRGEKSFRDDYGDYFVSGYQYGGTFNAYIAITTETTEQLKSLKFEVGAKLQNLSGISADSKFSQEMQDIMSKYSANINVDIRVSGAGHEIPTSIPVPNSSDIKAMNNVISEIMTFRNALQSAYQPNTYVPINVKLRRIRSVGNMNRYLAIDIPVPAEQSDRIQKFNREMVYGRGYRNVLASIPAGQVDTIYTTQQGGLVASFDQEVDFVSNRRNTFYTRPVYIEQALPQLIELNKKLKDMADRYTFYRALVEAQGKESGLAGEEITSKPFGQNGGSSGYMSFGVSAAVTADINAGGSYSDSHSTTRNVGWDEWNPKFEEKTDCRYCYVRVGAKNEHDNRREVVNPPAVGRFKPEFMFEAGYDRDGTWEVFGQRIRMPRHLYPFTGLKD